MPADLPSRTSDPLTRNTPTSELLHLLMATPGAQGSRSRSNPSKSIVQLVLVSCLFTETPETLDCRAVTLLELITNNAILSVGIISLIDTQGKWSLRNCTLHAWHCRHKTSSSTIPPCATRSFLCNLFTIPPATSFSALKKPSSAKVGRLQHLSSQQCRNLQWIHRRAWERTWRTQKMCSGR